MKIKHILTTTHLLFALCPALIIILFSASYFKSHVQESIETSLGTITNIEAANVTNYFSALSTQVNPLHSIPMLQEYLTGEKKGDRSSKEFVEKFLSSYLQVRSAGRSDVNCLYVMDMQGKILVSSRQQDVGKLSPNIPKPEAFATQKYVINLMPEDSETGRTCFSVTLPLNYNGQTLGYLTVEYTTEYFEQALQKITMYRTGNMFLLDSQGKIIAATVPGLLNKNITTEPLLNGFVQCFFQKDFDREPSGILCYQLKDNPRIAYYMAVPDTNWILLSSMNDKTFNAFLQNFNTTLMALCGVLLFVSLLASVLVSRRIITPAERFIDTIRRIKEGDRSARFHYTKRNELGMIAEAFNGLVRATNKRTAHLKGLSAKLRKQQEHLETLTHNIPGGLFRCSCDRLAEFSFISDGFLDILSFDRDNFELRCGNSLSKTIHADEREQVLDDIMSQLQEKQAFEVRYCAMMGFGSCCWIQVKGELKSDNRSGATWVDGLAIDVSEQIQAQQYLERTMNNLRETLRELKVSEERLRLIIDHSSDIIFEWSAAQRYIYLSPGFKKRFGYAPLLPDGFCSLMRFKDIHPEDIHNFRRWIFRLGKSLPAPVEDFRVRTAEGNYLWTRHQITLIRDKEGRIVRAVGLLIDVHEAKCAELQLLNKAERDALSGLYNRITFEEKAQAVLSRAQGREGQVAFMFLDIDDFRRYNTDHGHAFGDRIINFIGTTLTRQVSYSGFAGRRGGDEFVVCCEHFSSTSRLERLAEDIQHKLNEGLTARGNVQVSVTCSIGIVQVSNPNASFEELIHVADIAMYEVKKHGKASYSLVQV